VSHQRSREPTQHSPSRAITDDRSTANINDSGQTKDKKAGSSIRDGVKNLVKSGIDNIKSVLPLNRNDEKNIDCNKDGEHQSSIEPIEPVSNTAESPSLIEKFKSKFKRSVSPTNTGEQEKEPSSYEHLWEASSSQPEGRHMRTRVLTNI
jgi:hypothetical protein